MKNFFMTIWQISGFIVLAPMFILGERLHMLLPIRPNNKMLDILESILILFTIFVAFCLGLLLLPLALILSLDFAIRTASLRKNLKPAQENVSE